MDFLHTELAMRTLGGRIAPSRAFAKMRPDGMRDGMLFQPRSKLGALLLAAAVLPRPGFFGTVFLGRAADGGFLVRREFKVKRGRGGRRNRRRAQRQQSFALQVGPFTLRWVGHVSAEHPSFAGRIMGLL